MATRENKAPRYVVCVDNRDYPASLIVRRIYVSLPDQEASRRKLIRIIDESGEEYLYPTSYFGRLSRSLYNNE